MGMKKQLLIVMISSVLSTTFANAATTQSIVIEMGKQKFLGDLYTPDKPAKKLPLVVVIHEWWGKNEYPAMRAKKIADELGYAALVVDLYGDGKVVETPKEAGDLAAPFYQKPAIAIGRIQMFISAAQKQNKNIDIKKLAAIGYCFGGTQALALARTGRVNNVVAFHAGLGTPIKVVNPKKEKHNILVLHGEADQFIKPEEIKAFKNEMKNQNMKFISYPGATHAFTNPRSTEVGKKYNIPIAYNEKADKASWSEMVTFLKRYLN